MPNASSNAITNSTWSSESAPRSSTNDAVGVTSASSTPSCSTIICLTRSSTLAIPVPPRSLIALSNGLLSSFPRLSSLHYARGVQPRQNRWFGPLRATCPFYLACPPRSTLGTIGEGSQELPRQPSLIQLGRENLYCLP